MNPACCLSSLLREKEKKKSKPRKNNDNTFLCGRDSKAAAAPSAVFPALRKRFSCATGLRESLSFFFPFFPASLRSAPWVQLVLPQRDAACPVRPALLGRPWALKPVGFVVWLFLLFPKAKRYVWNPSSCRRGGFSGASSRFSVSKRRWIRSGCQLLVERNLQAGRRHGTESTAQTPFGKILCSWNKCCGAACALTDQEKFAQLWNGINENTYWGTKGIKYSSDRIKYQPWRKSKGQKSHGVFLLLLLSAFFFFFNELTYHERKKWICRDFISSSDPSFTSLTGDSHIYIHSTCHFSCSEL